MTAPDPDQVKAALKLPIGRILAAHPFDITACACGEQVGTGWDAWIAHVVRQPVPLGPEDRKGTTPRPRPVRQAPDSAPRWWSADN